MPVYLSQEIDDPQRFGLILVLYCHISLHLLSITDFGAIYLVCSYSMKREVIALGTTGTYSQDRRAL